MITRTEKEIMIHAEYADSLEEHDWHTHSWAYDVNQRIDFLSNRDDIEVLNVNFVPPVKQTEKRLLIIITFKTDNEIIIRNGRL